MAGVDLARDPQEVRRRIGYVPQGGSTDPAETGRGELVIQGRLYGLDKTSAVRRANEVLEALELTAAADRPTQTYSGGMRRRLDVGLGIVHRPRVLFLDEPTTGLDPQARARMWDEIRNLRELGTTVFLTTHYLEEADALADRLAIIDHGQIVAEGTADSLKRQVAGDVITLGIDGDHQRVLDLVRAESVRPRGLGRGRADPPLRRPGRQRRPAAHPAARRGRPPRPHVDARPAEPRRRLPSPDRPIPSRGARGMTATTAITTTRPTTTTRNPAVQLVRDTWLIFHRSLWLTIRQPTWIVFGMMLPLLYLFLFGPLLEGATQAAGTGTNAFNWFVPGLLIQIAIFGTAFVGFGLIAELRSGVIERMRVTPMSRGAMLLGRSLRDVVILMFQAILLIVLAIPLGLKVDLPGIAVVLALLVLIGLAVAPLSYAAALILKSEDAFAPLVQGIAMPLLLLSGILLPMALAPDWLQTLSSLNPFTHTVNAARALFNGQWGDPEIAIGVVITAVFAVISVWIAARTFSRANA